MKTTSIVAFVFYLSDALKGAAARARRRAKKLIRVVTYTYRSRPS